MEVVVIKESKAKVEEGEEGALKCLRRVTRVNAGVRGVLHNLL